MGAYGVKRMAEWNQVLVSRHVNADVGSNPAEARFVYNMFRHFHSGVAGSLPVDPVT